MTSTAPESDPGQALLNALLERHPKGVQNILLYGACLRSGDWFNGLVDVYLIVDSYRDFYGRALPAVTNWMLPPNVFYLEIPVAEQRLRSKVTVISRADFRRGARRWFEPYIWGRFCQPVDILYSAGAADRQNLECLLNDCRRRFLNSVLPRLPARGLLMDVWRQGLALSYGSELRAEHAGRSGEVVAADFAHYEQSTITHCHYLDFTLQLSGTGHATTYLAQVPRWRRLLGQISWPLRRLQGKIFSVMRVLKALFTFEGGLDYLAYKLEKHSGEKIEIPDRLRRYPLIFVWGFLIRLYRRGIIR